MQTNVSLKQFMSSVFGMRLMHFSVLLMMPLHLAQSIRNLNILYGDPDLWWHIQNARILFTQHHFIYQEPYAFTVAGKPWVNPEWLGEIPFWLSFHWLGARGIFLCAWILLVLNGFLVYHRAERRAGMQSAFWASMAAVILFTINASARTILCGYIWMSILLLILDAYESRRTKAIWLLPFVFCLWINTHGSWLIGFLLFGIYILSSRFDLNIGAFEQKARTSKEQRTLLFILFLSAAAIFINPYGWHLVWNPFDMIFQQKLNIAFIDEWQPLNFELLVGKISAVLIVIMLISSMIKGRKWTLHEFVWLLFAWYSAFDHRRFAFLAAVIIAPTLAYDLKRLVWTEEDKKTIPVMNAAFAAGALALLIYMTPTEKHAQEMLDKSYPHGLIAMIQPSWRTLNQYELGGRLAFLGKPDFVDSRVDIFEHAGVFRDYLEAATNKDSYEVLDKYKIDHILFKDDAPFMYLMKRSPQWRIVQKQDDWVLLERVSTMQVAAAQ